MAVFAYAVLALCVSLVHSRGIETKNSAKYRGNKLITSCQAYEAYTPENGRRALQGTLIGNEAKFACLQGFVLVGEAVSTCLPTGQWSSRSPWCRPICEYTKCPNGTKCEYDFKEHKPVCKCKTEFDCPLSYEPLCGSDGRTYATRCIFDTTACVMENASDFKAGSSLTVKSQGTCGNEDQNVTCPMCPKIKRCPALYESTFALTGKVVQSSPDLPFKQLDLIVQVDEVFKGYEFFKPGKKSVIKVQLRREPCPCVPRIPLGKALFIGRTIYNGVNNVKVPLIDELSFVEKYYSHKQLSLCWLY